MGKYENELTKLVYDYSSKGNIADGLFVEKVLDLGIHNLNIGDYVRSYEITNSYKGCVPTGYSIDKKCILIDNTAFLDDALNMLDIDEQQGIKSTTFVKNLKINLSVLGNATSVLSRASQYKTCLEGKDSIEKEVLELALERNLGIIRKEKFPPETLGYFILLDAQYREKVYYNALPSVRMARIKGLEIQNNISKLIPSEQKDNIETYTDWQLTCGQIEIYSAQSPTAFIKYVHEQLKNCSGLPSGENDLDEIEAIYREKSKDLGLERRLYLGLPITVEERNKMLIKRDVLKESL